MLSRNFTQFYSSPTIKKIPYLFQIVRFRRYIPVYLPIIKRRKVKLEALKASKKSDQIESEKPQIDQEEIKITYFSLERALELLRLLHKSLPKDEQSQNGYVSLNMILKVDTSRSSIRGSVLMPHPIGKIPRVLAICDPADERLAISNGARYAGLDVYIDKIASGWMDFDRVVCTPQYMPKLLKVARILGPIKLMPTFKSGTLTTNLIDALKILTSSNSLQYRTESINAENLTSIGLPNTPHGELDVSIGMLSQSDEMLMENIDFLVKEIAKKRPIMDVKKDKSNASFTWPPGNFISHKYKESRYNKIERYIKLLELGNSKAVDLSTFFVSSSLHIPDTTIPPIHTRII